MCSGPKYPGIGGYYNEALILYFFCITAASVHAELLGENTALYLCQRCQLSARQATDSHKQPVGFNKV